MITEFIEANLGRIEATAQEATPGPWSVIGFGEYVSGVGIVVAPDDGGVTSADAAHIALHDPTHVLAWVAAIRAVVAEVGIFEEPEFQSEAWHVGKRILRAIAGIFRDQPGWDEAWA